jgi:hypothetical protein
MGLADAVANSRKALLIATPDKMPVDRSTALKNQSVALYRQSERTSDATEAARLLDDSIAACRAALSVRTQGNMSAERAKTQPV